MNEASLLYVYGIVRSDFDAARAPAGIDDAAVETSVQDGPTAALVSRLPRASYSADAVERASGDVSWLSPRAMAHDRVLTWAQEHGGVIPVPMFSLWASEQSLAESLTRRQSEFDATFARVRDADEYGMRVHRRDAEMLQRIADVDEEIATLQRAAEAAPPGQRYLLERKMQEQKKAAVRRASQAMARELFESLQGLSREAIARPLTPTPGASADATLVLNGAFLVPRERLAEFKAIVGSAIERLEPMGLSFDFTGPWPPYNFSGAA